MMQSGWQTAFESAPVGYDVTIADSVHNNFTDDGLLYGPLFGALGILGSIDGQRATVITRDVVRAFIDQYLIGGSPSGLDTVIASYPELIEK